MPGIQRERSNKRQIPDFQFEDKQLQDTLDQFRNTIIDQEGEGKDGNQGFVRVQDLVDAGLVKIVQGKMVKA